MGCLGTCNLQYVICLLVHHQRHRIADECAGIFQTAVVNATTRQLVGDCYHRCPSHCSKKTAGADPLVTVEMVAWKSAFKPACRGPKPPDCVRGNFFFRFRKFAANFPFSCVFCSQPTLRYFTVQTNVKSRVGKGTIDKTRRRETVNSFPTLSTCIHSGPRPISDWSDPQSSFSRTLQFCCDALLGPSRTVPMEQTSQHV